MHFLDALLENAFLDALWVHGWARLRRSAPPRSGHDGQSAAAGVWGGDRKRFSLRLLLQGCCEPDCCKQGAVASGGGGGGGGSGDGKYKRVQKLALTLQWPFGLGRERTSVF